MNCESIRSEIAELHMDNFFFIKEIVQDFSKNQFDKTKMKDTYDNFMR